MNKEFFGTKTVLPNHSTVIGYFSNNSSDPESSTKENVDEILVSFNLVVKLSNLTKSSHYTTYQQKLYRLIKFLKEKRGIGYRRISHILTEKGYRSVRTNSILKNSYIYTIYSKGKIRENRINKDFESEISYVKINYIYEMKCIIPIILFLCFTMISCTNRDEKEVQTYTMNTMESNMKYICDTLTKYTNCDKIKFSGQNIIFYFDKKSCNYNVLEYSSSSKYGNPPICFNKNNSPFSDLDDKIDCYFDDDRANDYSRVYNKTQVDFFTNYLYSKEYYDESDINFKLDAIEKTTIKLENDFTNKCDLDNDFSLHLSFLKIEPEKRSGGILRSVYINNKVSMEILKFEIYDSPKCDSKWNEKSINKVNECLNKIKLVKQELINTVRDKELNERNEREEKEWERLNKKKFN